MPSKTTLTDEQIEAELQAAGIDMEPAYKRLHAMIDTHRKLQALLVACETALLDLDPELYPATCACLETAIAKAKVKQ